MFRSNKYIINYVILLLMFFAASNSLYAAEYQWAVKLKGYISGETNDEPTAYLWIPSNCKQVRAVVVGQHNMCEETIFDNESFRNTMTELGFAVVWISPGFEQQWDVKNGCQKIFDDMMNDLAAVSGYGELKYAPIVPIGHSAMATFPWNFAAWNPQRTLAVISYHGDAPRTNLTGYGRENIEWGRNRNIDGTPGLMIEGEYEWWEARVNPALAFRMTYPESCISFLCDAGRGHFDVSEKVVQYISLFLIKAAQYRLPSIMRLDKAADLIKIDPSKGWLAERWHPLQPKRPKPAPAGKYKGDVHDAFWYFDQEIAIATEQYYAAQRNKKEQFLGFINYGNLFSYNPNSHLKYDVSNFKADSDGITYHLSAAFTDSTHKQFSNKHAITPIHIERICGPVKKINDSTFKVDFYRMGFNNTRRINSISLCAYNDGDAIYKSAVQQFTFNLNYPLKEGTRQAIFFPAIHDVKEGSLSIPLSATTDSQLPVGYYVKEGPAKVVNGKLIFLAIPPRAKFPIKVTVVAWQYGLPAKVQSAIPVERSFCILK